MVKDKDIHLLQAYTNLFLFRMVMQQPTRF